MVENPQRDRRSDYWGSVQQIRADTHGWKSTNLTRSQAIHYPKTADCRRPSYKETNSISINVARLATHNSLRASVHVLCMLDIRNAEIA